MAYVSPNFKTKKALREALEQGKMVRVFQPGGIFPGPGPNDKGVRVEGPHYPEPHKWYGVVDLEKGRIVALDGKKIGIQGARKS